jgi:putative addiction module component (TIGR02574 family)
MPTLTPDEIKRLSPPERLALISDLWDSLDDVAPPLPPAQRDELARRVASFDADRAHAVTWDQLEAELAQRAP